MNAGTGDSDMSKNATSMDKVYDVFAEETRKQARIYELESRPKKATSARPAKPQEPASGKKREPGSV